MRDKSNIVLIGMPGSGKSTVGVVLAKLLAMEFVDTDLLIQQEEGRPLQKIVDEQGYLALRRVEERVICAIDCRNAVIATGGSATYSPVAMEHLKQDGTVIFLKVDLETISRRIGDYTMRGLAKRPEQTLADLFAERSTLYSHYADFTVDAASGSQESVARDMIAMLEQVQGES